MARASSGEAASTRSAAASHAPARRRVRVGLHGRRRGRGAAARRRRRRRSRSDRHRARVPSVTPNGARYERSTTTTAASCRERRPTDGARRRRSRQPAPGAAVLERGQLGAAGRVAQLCDDVGAGAGRIGFDHAARCRARAASHSPPSAGPDTGTTTTSTGPAAAIASSRRPARIASPLPSGAGANGTTSTALTCHLLVTLSGRYDHGPVRSCGHPRAPLHHASRMPRIPRTAHFVFGLRPQVEPFHLVHYLAIASCAEVVAPERIVRPLPRAPVRLLLGSRPPAGRAASDRTGRRRSSTSPTTTRSCATTPTPTRPTSCASTCSPSTAASTPTSTRCSSRRRRRRSGTRRAVIGREADVFDPRTEQSRSSLSNALVMAEPGAPLRRRAGATRSRTRSTARGARTAASSPTTWPAPIPTTSGSNPSGRSTPSPPRPTACGACSSTARPTSTAIVSIHLAAHLWWEETRRDFSPVHAQQIDEAWIRAGTHHLRARGAALPPRPWLLLTWTSGRAAATSPRTRRPATATPPTGSCARCAASGTARRVPRAGRTPAPAPHPRSCRSRATRSPTSARRPARRPSRTWSPSTTRSCVRWSPTAPFVAHTVWESDRLPQHWPDLLERHRPRDRADRVEPRGVRGQRRRARRSRSFPTSRPRRGPATGAPRSASRDDDFVFYTIGRWDERKAVFLAVEAYLRRVHRRRPRGARGEDRTRASRCHRASGAPATRWRGRRPGRSPRWCGSIRNPARSHLEVETWTDDRIAGLHTRGDCYLTLARGEGWGIGAFDAVRVRQPGRRHRMGRVPRVPRRRRARSSSTTQLTAVEHNAFASYSPDQQWAAPDLDHAVDVLRAVVADPELRRVRAPRTRATGCSTATRPTRVAATFLDVLSR